MPRPASVSCLNELENDCVLGEDPEDVDDAGDDPHLHSCQALGLHIINSYTVHATTFKKYFTSPSFSLELFYLGQ
jgi:hypothetical protein